MVNLRRVGLLGLFTLIFFQAGIAQPDTTCTPIIRLNQLGLVEGGEEDLVAPAFEGSGWTWLREIRYPEIAKKAGVEGMLHIAFTVTKEGQAEDIIVTRGIGAGCDEEVERAFQRARFTPAQHEGEPVAARMKAALLFELPECIKGTDKPWAGPCYAVEVPAIRVMVIDASAHRSDARQITGTATHTETGRVFADTSWFEPGIRKAFLEFAHHEAGHFDLRIESPGYETWSADQVRVMHDGCHPNTVQIEMALQPK